jgi:predicted dehydrogenase
MTDALASWPRRWGVWCNDPAASPWLKSLIERDPATSFVAVRATSEDDAVWHGITNVTFVADWQTLLVDQTLEAVFLAGTDDDRLSAMRQFAEHDRPVWIWPDARHGLPFAYELALIANDRPQHLHGVWLHRHDVRLQAVAAQIASGAITEVEHVELDRSQIGDDFADLALPVAMQRQLLADLDLMRWLGGQATRVTTLRTTGQQGRLRKQSVLLAAESGPGISWAGEFRDQSGAQLRLLGRQRLTLTQNATGQWSVEGETPSHPSTSDLPLGVPWAEVVRVFEWFDACEHSLERRRTIELHSEPVSERTVFKTQMTAIGCLLLMATLLFLLIYLAVGATVPLPHWMLMVLRALVFAPLAVFLLAQLLLPLARMPRPTDERETK